MYKPTLYIFRGLPGSGKTMHYLVNLQRQGVLRVSKDDLRAMTYGYLQHDATEHVVPYNAHNEACVKSASLALITTLLDMQRSVAVDDTNLKEVDVEQLMYTFQSRAFIQIVDLTDVPIETCIARDKDRATSENTALRKNPVGEAAIRELAKRLPKKAATEP